MNKEELSDELMVSCNKYMTCSICKQEIGYNRDGDEDLMKDHFREKHGFKEYEISN